MLGEDAPDSARVFDDGLTDAEIVHGDALAIEHAEDVVIGLDEEGGGIGEGLIFCEPRSLGVPVRADERQLCNVRVKGASDFPRGRVGGKEAVFVDEHGCDSTPWNFTWLRSDQSEGQPTSIQTGWAMPMRAGTGGSFCSADFWCAYEERLGMKKCEELSYLSRFAAVER